MRGVAAVALVVACGGGGTDAIDGQVPPIDAPEETDARPDATGGGFRIGGLAYGVRGPVPMRVVAGAEQTVQVSADGVFEFPNGVPDGTPYTVTMDGSPPCALGGGTGVIAGADVVVDLVCDGVVELSAVGFSDPVVLTPPFDPVQIVYSGTRPALLEDPDTFVVTPTAAYPGIPTLMVNGGAATSGQPVTVGETTGADVRIELVHPVYPQLARTYTFSLAAGTPAQDGYVKASNTFTGDQFGWAVAASGDTIAIGAPREDGGATGVDGDQSDNSMIDAGAVYVFRRAGTSWVQEAYIKASNTGIDDRFGTSVALFGDVLVVGADLEDSSTTGVGSTPDEGASGAGAAYVYRRTGTTWAFEAYLKASNTGVNDHFGGAVAVAGDVIAIGALDEDSGTDGVNTTPNEAEQDAGAVYVYRWSGSAWVFEAYLKASNSETYDGFGRSVAATADTIVVGAPFEDSPAVAVGGGQGNGATDSGAVYVFAYAGSWTQQAYVKATNTAADQPALGDWFGWSVAVDGDALAAGAPNEDGGGSDTGAAYMYRRNGGAWAQDGYVKAAVTDISDEFGYSVELDRNHLAIGAHREDGGTTGVGGNQADDTVAGAGCAYVFHRVGGNWLQQYYVKASNPGINDHAGYSVAMDRDTMIVGAHVEDSSATGVDGPNNNDQLDSGAVYAFR
jgi:hypothetical protein